MVKSPAAHRIYDVWDAARRGRLGPALGPDLKVDDIGWDLMPCVTIVDVIDGGRDFFFRYWGTRHAAVKRLEMSGKLLSETPIKEQWDLCGREFRDVIEQRAPLAFERAPFNSGSTTLPQMSVRFPLSSDGTTISGIMSYQDLTRPDNAWGDLFNSLWGTRAPEDNYSRLY